MKLHLLFTGVPTVLQKLWYLIHTQFTISKPRTNSDKATDNVLETRLIFSKANLNLKNVELLFRLTAKLARKHVTCTGVTNS